MSWKDVFVIALDPGWQPTQTGRRPSSGKKAEEEVALTSHQSTVNLLWTGTCKHTKTGALHLIVFRQPNAFDLSLEKIKECVSRQLPLNHFCQHASNRTTEE